MRRRSRILLIASLALCWLMAPSSEAQTKPTTSGHEAQGTNEASTKKTNLDAYIALLRRDVRQEKAEIMGAMMALNAQDSAKFWPIYSEYDTELTKLNDQRVQNIKEYVQNYDEMTDEKADQLIQNAAAYQKQRTELLVKTYQQVKQALGGTEAARFAMIEHQLLALIDLEVESSLPLAGQSK